MTAGATSMLQARFDPSGDNGAGGEYFIYRGWHDPRNRWNGWAKPRFDRGEALRIITACNADLLQGVRAHFDGDTIVWNEDDQSGGVFTTRIEPDAAGRYRLGEGWTWLELEAVPLPEMVELSAENAHASAIEYAAYLLQTTPSDDPADVSKVAAELATEVLRFWTAPKA